MPEPQYIDIKKGRAVMTLPSLGLIFHEMEASSG
jgi:hypothetical protein